MLARDPWEYVSLFLRRERSDDAKFYWDQAQQFFRASRDLSATASPLTSYYAVLNATKALLNYKAVTGYADEHGVDGNPADKKAVLSNEIVRIKTGGVLPAFSGYLGSPVNSVLELPLDNIFYSLPFVHRAYTLTFRSVKELFVPLKNGFFVRHPRTAECWFVADVEERYATAQLKRALPKGWEVDDGWTDGLRIRMKKRFKWNERKDGAAGLRRLTRYHRDVRSDVLPIVEPNNRWYLRRRATPASRLPEMVLIYAALHRVSELARYEPLRLRSHLDARHNWLLAEFLGIAPAQFIGLLASEITGREFLSPSAVRL